jgi:DNA-binding transcriptional MerR regulator
VTNTEYFMPIGELAKKLDIPSHTLRYWEKEFPTLIQPTTGAGGRRFFRPETVEAITALKRYLYADGYTIDGVKKLVANGGFTIEHNASAPAESDSATAKAMARPAVRIEAPHPEPAMKEAAVSAAIRLLHEARDVLKV